MLASVYSPRGEFEARLVDKGLVYFESLNRILKLDVYFRIIGIELEGTRRGHYHSLWRAYNFTDDKFGEICIDVSKFNSEEDLFMVIRHEICHAVCDLRFNIYPAHCKRWIRLAKLFRVNTKQYEHAAICR